MKDVIISIKGRQSYHETEEMDKVELITTGKYRHHGGETVFSYMESEMTGENSTFTVFRVSPQAAILTREGATTAQMIFEQGKKNIFLHETPWGTMTMGLDTRRLAHGLGESGGKMEIDYMIDIDSAVVGEHGLVIDIREPGKASEIAT